MICLILMEKNLSAADRVLMICSERYVEKANSGSGGVGYEKMIVTSDMLKSIDSNKVIPLIRQKGSHSVPTFLKSKLFVDFSREEQFEFSFDELARTIHDSPLFIKPPVGSSPFGPAASIPPEKKTDAVRDLMQIVVADFETHSIDYIKYDTVREQFRASRVMLDHVIGQAKSAGLLTQDSDKDLRLTQVGKHYAIEHKLIR